MAHSSTIRTIVSGASALSLALAGTLIIAAPALADDVTVDSEATLVTAITNANGGTADLDTITLTADITLTSNLPTIQDDLVIDGAGHKITGAGSYGIVVYVPAVTIKNLTMKEMHEGIHSEGSEVTITDSSFDDAPVYLEAWDASRAVTVTGTSFVNSSDDGLHLKLYGDSVTTLTEVTVTGNGDDGIEVASSDEAHVTVTGMVSKDNVYGMYLELSDDTVTDVSNSTVTSNDRQGVLAVLDESAGVTLNDVSTIGNGAEGVDVEISQAGHASITSLTSRENGGHGVAISEAFQPADGMVTVSDSTIADNDNSGICVEVAATPVLIERSTISGNGQEAAGYGGGLCFISDGSAPVTLLDSTVSGNSAETAGGIYAAGDGADGGVAQLVIRHTTIVGNSSASGYAGGVAIDGVGYLIDHSIVAGNVAEGDPFDFEASVEDGQNESVTYTLIQYPDDPAYPAIASGAGNNTGVDPMLGALADNGGPTLTHLPLADSPVIGAGDPAISGAPATDQRGEVRIFETIDLGAVEVVPAPVVPDPADPALAETGTEIGMPLTAGVLMAVAGILLVLRRRRARLHVASERKIA